MNRLSALDASFVYGEAPETPMNVGSLAIFASPANPDVVFARFRDHTVARLDQLPLYRRRLEMTPLGLDHPAWIDDDDLDLDYHIHRAALPKPGAGAGRAAARDPARSRARPLWQYYLIEGLEDGGFAVYFKFHHCDMDGVASWRLSTRRTISRPSPRPRGPPRPSPISCARDFARRHRCRTWRGRWRKRLGILAGTPKIRSPMSGRRRGRASTWGRLEPPQLRRGVAIPARREGDGEGEQCNDQRCRPGSLRWRLASQSDRAPVVARCAADCRRASLPARARRHADEQSADVFAVPPLQAPMFDNGRPSRCPAKTEPLSLSRSRRISRTRCERGS